MYGRSFTEGKVLVSRSAEIKKLIRNKTDILMHSHILSMQYVYITIYQNVVIEFIYVFI